jgi:hypothetical protein
MVLDLFFHDAPFIAGLLLVLGPPLSVAWLIREFDQRQTEQYERLVNEQSLNLRCPRCNGRFAPWSGGFVPAVEFDANREPLGRRLHLACHDCGSCGVIRDQHGTLEVESLLSENTESFR